VRDGPEREDGAEGGEDPARVGVADRLEEQAPFESVGAHVPRQEQRDEPGADDDERAGHCTAERGGNAGATDGDEQRPRSREIERCALDLGHTAGGGARPKRRDGDPEHERAEQAEERPIGPAEGETSAAREHGARRTGRERRRRAPRRRVVAAAREAEPRHSGADTGEGGHHAERERAERGDGDVPSPRPRPQATGR
jgi:hypothetical protein